MEFSIEILIYEFTCQIAILIIIVDRILLLELQFINFPAQKKIVCESSLGVLEKSLA